MRNLKASGLVVMAMLAIAALTAATAWANQFHSGANSTTWTVTSNAFQVFEYEAGGEAITCATIGGEAQTTAQTVTEITFKPTYSTCKAEELLVPAHVAMNECDYLLTINASESGGWVHLKCPAFNTISITVTNGFGSTLCTLHIGQQTPVGGVDYANNGASRVNVQPTESGISGQREGSALCGVKESISGTYFGQVTVRGEITGQQTATNVQVG